MTDPTDAVKEIERLTRNCHDTLHIHTASHDVSLGCYRIDALRDIALRLAEHVENMKNSVANGRGAAVASLIEANAILIGRVSHFEQENARLKAEVERLRTIVYENVEHSITTQGHCNKHNRRCTPEAVHD